VRSGHSRTRGLGGECGSVRKEKEIEVPSSSKLSILEAHSAGDANRTNPKAPDEAEERQQQKKKHTADGNAPRGGRAF